MTAAELPHTHNEGQSGFHPVCAASSSLAADIARQGAVKQGVRW